jgi:hypothetical protein
MEIEINLKLLKENNITPNQYVFLYLKNEKLYNDYIQLNLDEFSHLLQERFITLDELTDKGKNLFSKNTVNDWIKEWLNLWPKEILHGYRVSGNSLQVIKKMKTFCKEFPEYNKDIIFKATNNYLQRKKNENWEFTKKNSKFIFDIDGSTLEQECIAIVENIDKSQQSNVINL